MTERKPRGTDFESFVERQIRQAMERGELDSAAAKGKPIPGIERPHDEMWWVKDKLRRGNVSWLPPTLALRKEPEGAVAAAMSARTEARVREIVTAMNEKIRAACRQPMEGPPLSVSPIDIERVLYDWKARHVEQTAANDEERHDDKGHIRPLGHWWQRPSRRPR